MKTKPDSSKKPAPATGWICPVCGRGNAPFARTCGNRHCGISITITTGTTGQAAGAADFAEIEHELDRRGEFGRRMAERWIGPKRGT